MLENNEIPKGCKFLGKIDGNDYGDRYYANSNGDIFVNYIPTKRSSLNKHDAIKNTIIPGKPVTVCNRLVTVQGKVVKVNNTRITATLFIPNPRNFTMVSRINKESLDVSINNIIWGDYDILVSSHIRKEVHKYSKDGNYIKTYVSGHEASAVELINRVSISLACRSRIQTAGGFRWSFNKVDKLAYL